jgi:hypothetical protein
LALLGCRAPCEACKGHQPAAAAGQAGARLVQVTQSHVCLAWSPASSCCLVAPGGGAQLGCCSCSSNSSSGGAAGTVRYARLYLKYRGSTPLDCTKPVLMLTLADPAHWPGGPWRTRAGPPSNITGCGLVMLAARRAQATAALAEGCIVSLVTCCISLGGCAGSMHALVAGAISAVQVRCLNLAGVRE